MEHIIIRETCSEIRTIARKALRGNWLGVVVAMAIYYLLMITLPNAIDVLIPGASINTYNETLDENITFPMVSTLYSIFLTGPFELGVASFFIYFFRKRELHPGHLFDGFEHFFKAVILTVLIGLRVFFWSLLLVIPGIIAAIRYSQAFYILADHPEYSAGECIRQSKAYMAGNKGKYCLLLLSFIGWALLAGVAAIPLDYISLTGVSLLVADYIVSIPHFFYLAYLGVGQIVFYELVSGNLMARPEAEKLCGMDGDVVQPIYEEKTNDDEFNF